MSDLSVMHEANDRTGRYWIVHPSGQSELTYSIVSAKRVIADHTQVSSGHEGETIGLMLLGEMVADARSEGFQIVPLCSFVNAQRHKHSEWADVFST